MSERLSLATVATCAVLAGVGFGGAYALAHDEPPPPSPAPASPAAIRLEGDPIGELHRASPLPALIVPPPRTQPTETVPVTEDQQPVVTIPASEAPAATPTPEPTPTPTPKSPPAKKPLTFDDSG
jgi:hypothetical protein